MKTLTRILILLLLVCTVVIPTTAFASGNNDDKVIFGGNYTLHEGETLNGDLVVFGGNVTLETASTINGDTVVFGGSVTSNGTVNGNLVALGGIVNLGSEAQINGDLTIVGSSFNQDPNARITGNIVTEENVPFDFNFPKDLGLFEGKFPSVPLGRMPFASPGWFFFRVLIWTGLAVLIALFIQDQAAVINRTAFGEPILSGVVGLGVILVAPLVLLALVITILLSPVSLVGIFALIAAWVVGLVSLSIEVGRKLSKAMNQDWPVPLMAALGMFILVLFFNGFSQLVPCVGWLPKFILGAWVMGAVILTRFGTHAYPEQEPALAVKAGEPLPEAFPAAEIAAGKPAVDATDSARDLAQKEGIDLSKLSGSGTAGRITINDVRKAIKDRG
jgi:pyruvate/2-oxoglutarate dehydrogenase complex dihydrolipoamide acyltransferase (E2) component